MGVVELRVRGIEFQERGAHDVLDRLRVVRGDVVGQFLGDGVEVVAVSRSARKGRTLAPSRCAASIAVATAVS